MSATYSAPSRNAMPVGIVIPLSTVFTSLRPPLSTTAYTLPAPKEPTKSVPLSPHAICRALGTPPPTPRPPARAAGPPPPPHRGWGGGGWLGGCFFFFGGPPSEVGSAGPEGG